MKIALWFSESFSKLHFGWSVCEKAPVLSCWESSDGADIPVPASKLSSEFRCSHRIVLVLLYWIVFRNTLQTENVHKAFGLCTNYSADRNRYLSFYAGWVTYPSAFHISIEWILQMSHWACVCKIPLLQYFHSVVYSLW